METEFIIKAREFAEYVFNDRSFENRAFHNISHTREVVRAAEEIGRQTSLNDDELESVIIAAWLHDIGYVSGQENHEMNAALKSKELLQEWGASQKKITEVTEAIMATKMPQQPKTLVSKVLCDADLYHLSTEQCTAKAENLRKEWEHSGHKVMNEAEWVHSNLSFMENHRYHTPYGQEILQQGKKKNIKKLRKLVKPEFTEKKFHKLEDEVVKLKAKLEKEKLLKPDRGIETMFRTTSQNHLMLSQMADNKSNILITINSIILSVVVSVLVRKLEENPRLIVPTIMLITVCLATTVFAILATRPNISSGRFTREDIKNKRTNLLFFGNFHGMKVEDYEWSMKEMMKDADYLYGSLIKDIYFLGIVLAKKYKFLRIAYNVFMFGFVVSILSFIVAFMLSPKI
ncbi:Pycsar system effector family protein [Chryseosolibacter indicus]|uniref:HD domain-containing protein n=1 Tax=Chryseosolibacter indicus TaxID=2782351 RepID=A0ABS5VLS4_9BACT|nr:Pycsar system effector family protein [Chryseosolibacter indicus]MBT1701722.1 HD domain-containing protein [Chryseosolibacter indicus]